MKKATANNAKKKLKKYKSINFALNTVTNSQMREHIYLSVSPNHKLKQNIIAYCYVICLP